MNRSALSLAAILALVGLTLTSGWAAETQVGPLGVGALGALKIAIIGAVFLELDRAWVVWAALAASLTLAVTLGSGLLMGAG
ncbi:MAG: hypothetical protein H6741_24630 [Alphaproteobacteria bacterium]|nr:hypothetical protein [Alphaproteobacteria bacterium]